MTTRTLATIMLVALPLLLPPAPAAFAQQAGLTLDQVERKYPRMSPVHIQKCDHSGDGIYTKSEMLCVQSIYQAMYVSR